MLSFSYQRGAGTLLKKSGEAPGTFVKALRTNPLIVASWIRNDGTDPKRRGLEADLFLTGRYALSRDYGYAKCPLLPWEIDRLEGRSQVDAIVYEGNDRTSNCDIRIT